MPDNAREIFVKNLRFLMDRKGYTQADIVNTIGVTSATASDWCNGKIYPRIDKIQKLADMLGVGISTLTTEDGLRDIDDMDRLEALHQNPRLGMLFDHERKMSHEDVEFMIGMAERILKERDRD